MHGHAVSNSTIPKSLSKARLARLSPFRGFGGRAREWLCDTHARAWRIRAHAAVSVSVGLPPPRRGTASSSQQCNSQHTTCLLIVPLDPSLYSVSAQYQLIATQKDYRAFSIFSPLCCLLLLLSQKIQKRIHSSSSLCYILERFYSIVTEVPVTHLICTLSKQSSLLHHVISSDTFHARRLCSGSRPIDSVVL